MIGRRSIVNCGYNFHPRAEIEMRDNSLFNFTTRYDSDIVHHHLFLGEYYLLFGRDLRPFTTSSSPQRVDSQSNGVTRKRCQIFIFHTALLVQYIYIAT